MVPRFSCIRIPGIALAAVLAVSACGGTPHDPVSEPTSPPAAPSGTPRASDSPKPSGPTATASSQTPAPGSTPPAWLGSRVLPTDDPAAIAALKTPAVLRDRAFTLPDQLDPLPGKGFKAEITSPVPAEVLERSTWNQACPVSATDLDWIKLTFRGFDGKRHTGELLVHRTASKDLVDVFRELWQVDYPIEQMAITTVAERDAEPTGDGNGTGAFNCRPVTGGSSYSEHAYGLAIDLNPFQNPYLKGDVLLPELARSYLNRDDRPGVITADSPVVAAFAKVGWGWGGSWNSLKDYQHFSANNR